MESQSAVRFEVKP